MSLTGLKLRSAEAGDYQRVGDLILSAYLEGGHIDPDDAYVPHLKEVAHRAEHADLLVAEIDGDVAATVTLTDYDGVYAEVARPAEMEFRMLAVAPEYQGRGIARHLVRHIIATATTRPDVSAVALCSLVSMSGAHSLYRSEGFVADPTRDMVLVTPQKSGRFPFFRRKV